MLTLPSSVATRRLAASLAAIAAVLALAGPVLADVELASASPGPDDIVTGSPAELVVVFSGPVDPGRSSVLVNDASGATVAQGGADETSADGTTITVPLPTLEPGVFEVRWTAVATDGHVSRDTYVFTVEAATSPSPEPSPEPSPSGASAEPSSDASPSPAPTPAPSASPDPADPTTGDEPLSIVLPVLIVVAAVAILGVWWSRRRRGA